MICIRAARIFAITLIAVAAIGLASPAKAQFMTGDELLKNCAADSLPTDIHRCLGYIAGVIDYHVVMQSLGTNPSTDFCLPKGLKLEEAAMQVLIYLQKKPDQLGFIAAPAVALALNQVYPCAQVR